MAATQVLLCNICCCRSNSLVAATKPYNSKLSISCYYQLGKNKEWYITKPLTCYRNQKNGLKLKKTLFVCHSARRKPTISSEKGNGDNLRKVLQIILWVIEGVYILWLFLLPYAPGDPVWAISNETVNSLIGLSLNFFFILPFMNSAIVLIVTFFYKHFNSLYPRIYYFWNQLYGVGIHFINAPVLHPVSEGLFNFVIGWTFMFAPLLFTDCKRDRYQGSLDILWGLQMFLTNTFLIPYMAIRLSKIDSESTPWKSSQLGTVMTNGAPVVGLIGGLACLISGLWALYGRMDGGFGSITDRWEFLVSYLGSERLAYAFIWDICLYIIFQPWLIGDNLQNIQKSKVAAVNYHRFVPVVGLVAYLLCLNLEEEL